MVIMDIANVSVLIATIFYSINGHADISMSANKVLSWPLSRLIYACGFLTIGCELTAQMLSCVSNKKNEPYLPLPFSPIGVLLSPSALLSHSTTTPLPFHSKASMEGPLVGAHAR
jgi:hypothetical protein